MCPGHRPFVFRPVSHKRQHKNIDDRPGILFPDYIYQSFCFSNLQFGLRRMCSCTVDSVRRKGMDGLYHLRIALHLQVFQRLLLAMSLDIFA